jgi:NAD(P)-dependent dehydrogenase (short-subunit alcohol dehydrogenase family)
MKLEGRVALVTGASQGIGHACALALAREGASVAVAARNRQKLDELVGQIAAAGGKAAAFVVVMDVAEEEQVKSGIKSALAQFGKIDILVNNAGIGTRGQSLETISDDEWHEFIDGILSTQFYVARPVAKHMIARGQGGVMVNLASINAYIISDIAPRYNVPYCVAKAGVAHLTHGMATNWAKYHIRVNGIAPGFIPTEMGSTLMKYPDIMARMLAGQPIGRFGNPEEIKGVVVFLASEASSYMTGSIVVVDGGATLW